MIQVERCRSADRINRVLNDPYVRPWVADSREGVLDVSPQVADEKNVLLMGEHGGVFLFKLLTGFYEVHTQVLRSGRGAWTNAFLAAATHWMFTHTDAVEILTRVPQGHVAAKAATLANHMTYEFTRHRECKFRGALVDVDIYALRLFDWVKHYPAFIDRGRWFHDRLHAEALRLGITTPPHEDDENHNLYVGASFDMIANGELAKGVAFYNRWAIVSRHPPIAIVSSDPPVVKFDIGFLHLKADGDIEVSRAC